MYLANFYLYVSELAFFRQFYDLFAEFPPDMAEFAGVLPGPTVLALLSSDDEQFVSSCTPGQIGAALSVVLGDLLCVVRFVDDVITGPSCA